MVDAGGRVQDFVCSIKRYADPALQSPAWSNIERAGFTGLTESRQRPVG